MSSHLAGFAMFGNSLLVLLLATLALASPIPYNGQTSTCKAGKAVPVLPVNGGSSELSPPPRGETLKHIALGFGIQNYSCADAGGKPTATGALAVLYDVTDLYPGQDGSSLTAQEWSSLPATILNTEKVPLNRNGDGGASPNNPFPKRQSLKVKSLHRNISYLGRHFFNGAGVPTFDLDKANQLLVAKKIEGIKAPSSAPVGPEGTGAIDWLYLGDAGGSQGVSRVYRVLTAGGASHGCNVKGMDSTSYTALYWFYG